MTWNMLVHCRILTVNRWQKGVLTPVTKGSGTLDQGVCRHVLRSLAPSGRINLPDTSVTFPTDLLKLPCLGERVLVSISIMSYPCGTHFAGLVSIVNAD